MIEIRKASQAPRLQHGASAPERMAEECSEETGDRYRLRTCELVQPTTNSANTPSSRMACRITSVLPDRKFTREPVAATRNAKGVAATRLLRKEGRACDSEKQPIRAYWLIFIPESSSPKTEWGGGQPCRMMQTRQKERYLVDPFGSVARRI